MQSCRWQCRRRVDAGRSYGYDPLYRLQQLNDPTGAPWQRYTYDKTGGRLRKITGGATPVDVYHYAADSHHLAAITGADASSRAFDANGNTTALQANGWTYGFGYDDTNRLTLVQQNGTTVANYGLNGLGERAVKTLTGGGRQVYFYDEGRRLLAPRACVFRKAALFHKT